MTMFKGAVDNWRKKCADWKAYCEREDEKMVNPILVIQVEDGNDRIATQTDLGVLYRFTRRTLAAGYNLVKLCTLSMTMELLKYG